MYNKHQKLHLPLTTNKIKKSVNKAKILVRKKVCAANN